MKRFVTAIFIALASSNLFANDSLIYRAMQDELDRSMQELKFDSFGKPYYISYRMVDSHRYYISASLGAIISQEENLRRELVVELRVGDYKTDSSNLFELNFRRVPSLLRFDSKVFVPMDADYTEIRRLIWLATDSAYKSAVQRLAKKEALLANKKGAERPDDFLRVRAENYREKPKKIEVDVNDMLNLMKDLSAIGKDFPKIYMSELDWRFASSYTRIVDSEGRKIGKNDNISRILMRAATQADDGEPIFEEDFVFALTPEDFPTNRKLKKYFRNQFKTFSLRRVSPKMRSYVGPVIFKPKAAAELVRQTIAAKAAAYRQPEKDPSTSIQGFTANTLQGQIKQRILPRGFYVKDEPMTEEYDGEPLLGGYKFDDQGVAANSKELIKNGRLVDLISERSPIANFEVKGGNHLDGKIAASNIIFESKRPYSEKEMIEEMLILSEELELDYGIVIEKLDSHFNPLTRPSSIIFFGGNKGLTLTGLEAYKLYKDGRKERIRQLELANFDIRSLKDIVAAGEDYEVYHAPSQQIGGQFFLNSSDTRKYDISSFVVPSILFEELSLTPQEDASKSLPVSERSDLATKQ